MDRELWNSRNWSGMESGLYFGMEHETLVSYCNSLIQGVKGYSPTGYHNKTVRKLTMMENINNTLIEQSG